MNPDRRVDRRVVITRVQKNICKDYVLIANDIKNNCCILANGTIVLIENVAFSNDKRSLMIIGKEYLKK